MQAILVQEWVGEELTQCSLYGIRVYTEGAVLATHVDRLPLVSSAIVNVGQDVDEPWPIEVYGHDGKAYNVTMEPVSSYCAVCTSHLHRISLCMFSHPVLSIIGRYGIV